MSDHIKRLQALRAWPMLSNVKETADALDAAISALAAQGGEVATVTVTSGAEVGEHLVEFSADFEAALDEMPNGSRVKLCASPPVPVERGEDGVAGWAIWYPAEQRFLNYLRTTKEEAETICNAGCVIVPVYTKPQPAAHVDVAGWIHEDELPERYPYDAMFPHSKVDVVRMFPVFVPTEAREGK